jgi:hypothetical protein
MTVDEVTFRWWLGSLGANQMPSDEFVAGAFRIRLMGNFLELSFEGSGTPSPAAARELADRYLAALKHRLVAPLWLMTEEEFLARTTPPFGGMTAISASRADRERTHRAVNEARNELLAAADPALRRIYDYLRKAQEDDGRLDDNSIFYLYKAVETIEDALGGEAKAGQILGRLQEIKALKRAANERTGDERHAPLDPAATPPRADLGRALENTRAVVRAYEARLSSLTTYSTRSPG